MTSSSMWCKPLCDAGGSTSVDTGDTLWKQPAYPVLSIPANSFAFLSLHFDFIETSSLRERIRAARHLVILLHKMASRQRGVCVWNIWRDVKLLTLVVSYSAVSWISLSLIFNTERSWFSYSAVVSIFPEHQFQQGAEGSPDVASANEAPHWMIRKTYLQFSISFLSSMATG